MFTIKLKGHSDEERIILFLVNVIVMPGNNETIVIVSWISKNTG